MNITASPHIIGTNVKLVQAICMNSRHSAQVIKAVFIGVAEEVKAVCADLVCKKTVSFTAGDSVKSFYAPHMPGKTITRQLAPTGYAVGLVYYPGLLGKVVCGQPEELAARAFRLFRKEFGQSLPLIEEFAPILWNMAKDYGYADKLRIFGLEPGEEVYTLNLPSIDTLEELLMPEIPRFIDIAAELAA